VFIAQFAVNHRELRADELAKSLRANMRHVYNVPTELVVQELSDKRPAPLPKQGGGGNNPRSAVANATPEPQRDRQGEEERV
jgi:hypothetical protein